MIKNMAILDDNNRVLNIVVRNEQTVDTDNLVSYTRENPAYIGGDYSNGVFYPPKPFPSWSRDGAGSWVAPITMPEDDKTYVWVEEIKNWVEVPGETV